MNDTNHDIAIRVQGLGKRYRIGQREPYKTLRESLMGWFQPVAKSGAEPDAATGDEFWALRDVSFEVKRGEVMGIIGRNGAGKSTLLKVLSRITQPTQGRIEILGRVGSLLEVGTGFHPELSGRENVFLNGAILGMREWEIRRKFDEIVAFAEVEKFIDTPVKRYSSGMYTRLAFAVAAHLEPEILIVDEVLAVGDIQFQQKCLGKMQEVAGGGRTVLFVSHNMAAVSMLCNRCAYLQNGSLLSIGATRDVLEEYHERTRHKTPEANLDNARHTGSGAARFTSIRVSPVDVRGQEMEVCTTGSDLRIEVDVKALRPISGANVAVIIQTSNEVRLVDINTSLAGKFLSLEAGQSSTVKFIARDLLLRPGTYTIALWLGRGGIEDIDSIQEAADFTVEIADEIKHTEIFPGHYQCRFEVELALANDLQREPQTHGI